MSGIAGILVRALDSFKIISIQSAQTARTSLDPYEEIKNMVNHQICTKCG